MIYNKHKQNTNLIPLIHEIDGVDTDKKEQLIEYLKAKDIITYSNILDKIKSLGLQTSCELISLINTTENADRSLIMSELPAGSKLIYQVVVGSQAFGLATETSDYDIKGVFIEPNKSIVLSDNASEVVIIGKDETYFEIGKFMKMAVSNESMSMEMLFVDSKCIGLCTNEFKLILARKNSLMSKKLYYTFYRYATQQFKKATNYNKMANWEESRYTRKSVSEFCQFLCRETGNAYPFSNYLQNNGLSDQDISLNRVSNQLNTFKVYKTIGENVRGWYGENSNELRVSPIIKSNSNSWVGTIVFNHSDYSKHCADVRKYEDYKLKRNPIRYNDNKAHGQKYDAKNVMHTIRLIMTSISILEDGVINLDQSENRDYLLKIKHGDGMSLKDELDFWMNKTQDIETRYLESSLPNDVDYQLFKDLMGRIRDNKL